MNTAYNENSDALNNITPDEKNNTHENNSQEKGREQTVSNKELIDQLINGGW